MTGKRTPEDPDAKPRPRTRRVTKPAPTSPTPTPPVPDAAVPEKHAADEIPISAAPVRKRRSRATPTTPPAVPDTTPAPTPEPPAPPAPPPESPDVAITEVPPPESPDVAIAQAPPPTTVSTIVPPASPTTPMRRDRWTVIALILAAAVIRAWDLDHMSIWQDEGLSLYRAGLDLRGILAGNIQLDALVTPDVQPPLYFLLLAGWFKLVGLGTWTGKAFSLLVALPAVPLTWALVRRCIGRREALVAAALAAASPAYLWYSQELRHYTLLVTLGLLGVYALLRAWPFGLTPSTSPRRLFPWAIVAIAANAALVWTHYLGFCLVAFEVAYVLATAGRSRNWRAAAPLAALGLIALPLVPYALWRLGLGPERDQHFVGLHIMLKDIVLGFSFGKSADQGSPLIMVLDLGFAALLGIGIADLWRRRRPALVLQAGYLFIPVLALFALTLVKPVYMGVRHILMVSPAYHALVAAGVVAIESRRRDAGWVAGGLALAAMLVADAAFYSDARFRKDDWRALAGYVDAHAVPGDALVVPDGVLKLTLDHLARRVPVISVPPFVGGGIRDPRPPEEQLMPLFRRHPRLWYVDPPGGPGDILGWLEDRTLRVDRREFEGSTVPVYFNAYELAPVLRGGHNPPRTETLHLGALDLLGWDVRPEALASGAAGRVRLIWQVTARTLPDYKVSLVLRDDDGRDHAAGDHEPYHGQRPTSTWPFGELTYEPHDLVVDGATPPGAFTLGITVYDPATGETHPTDGPATLGVVRVERPAAPVDPQAIAIPSRLTAVGPGLTVLGHRLPAAEAVEGGAWAAGTRLTLDVWVRIDDPARAAHALRAELIDDSGRTGIQDAVPIASDTDPADSWQPGDIRRVRLPLRLPSDAGRYDVRVRVVDGDGAVRWLRRGRPAVLPVRGLWIDRLRVRAPERLTAEPPMAHRLGVSVGDVADLLGYDIGVDRFAPGQSVTFMLYWQPKAAVDTDYRVTVQLVPVGSGDDSAADDASPGPPIAQHDGIPASGSRPTAGWLPGEVIADPHRLDVPADLPPGAYLLIAALYDPGVPGEPRPAVRQGGQVRDYVVLERYEVGEDAGGAGR